MSSLDLFIDEQRRLLALEHAAELEESRILLESRPARELQAEGMAILRLKVEDFGAFLGEQILVTFVLNSGHKELPATTRLSNGDIVGVFAGANLATSPLTTGVIHSIGRGKVAVVVSEISDLGETSDVFSVCLVGNDVTHRRLVETLDWLKSARNHPVVSLAFNEQVSLSDFAGESEICPDRNVSQNAAISRCLFSGHPVCLIQGPPGAGKTSTLVSLIMKHVEISRRNFRSPHILVCAPSNAAVDNVAECLLAQGLSDIVRLGHPSRISETLEAVTLAARMDESEEAALCKDIRSEISQQLRASRKSPELKILRRELKTRMQSVSTRIIDNASVVLATCVGAAQLRQFGRIASFDFVAVDEAAQALEMACWLPLLAANCPRLVLAGDHKQLGPTVKNALASKLQETLFARLENKFGEEISSMLTTQYRMNSAIMDWSNSQFYGGKLRADEKVGNRLLADLTAQTVCIETDVFFESRDFLLRSPFIFVDTAYQDEFEEVTDGEVSRCNPGEAAVIAAYVDLLRSSGISDAHIGVITPYSRQAEMLKSLLGQTPQVATVDAFQGREKDAILISTVRSNSEGICGFLKDERRMNVAVTRAKRQVFIVGNSETLGNDANMKSLIDYCESIGATFPIAAFLDVTLLRLPEVSGSRPKLQVQDRPKVNKKKKPPTVRPTVTQTVVPNEPEKTPLPELGISEILENLLPGTTYDFPCTLRSDERRKVHEISERLGLVHESFGEQDARFIRVTRPALLPAQLPSLAADAEVSETHSISNSPTSVQSSAHSQPPPHKQQAKAKVKPKAKSTPSAKRVDPKKWATDDEFDAILDAEIAKQSLCGVCEESPSWTALPCNFCKRKFCSPHSFPEYHGCGAAAREEARTRAARTAKSQPSWKRDIAQRKLDDAIASKEKLRSSSKK